MDVKNGFANVFQFLSLISDNLGGVNTVSMVFGFFCKQMAANQKIQIIKKYFLERPDILKYFSCLKQSKQLQELLVWIFQKCSLYVNWK